MRVQPLVQQKRIPFAQMATIGLLPSPLKLAFYRLRGFKIGKGVRISLGSVLVGERVKVGEGTKIGFFTVVFGREITIGRYVKIGALSYLNANKIHIDDDARINNQVYAGGIDFPDSELVLGKRTIVMENTFLNPTRPLRIGDDTGIGGKCSIFTHGSWQSQLDGFPVTFAPVTLGKNVWIPWDVFIMPGVTIGDNATIGAGALVNKDIPEGSLAAGLPIKILQTKEQRSGRPDNATRHIMVKEYLETFREFMMWHRIKSDDLIVSEFGYIYNFSKRNRTYIVYYAELDVDWQAVLTRQAPLSAVCISLTAIDAQKRKIIKSREQMWIDLESRQRGGRSTHIGEQLVLFLSRYGVRFADEDF